MSVLWTHFTDDKTERLSVWVEVTWLVRSCAGIPIAETISEGFQLQRPFLTEILNRVPMQGPPLISKKCHCGPWVKSRKYQAQKWEHKVYIVHWKSPDIIPCYHATAKLGFLCCFLQPWDLKVVPYGIVKSLLDYKGLVGRSPKVSFRTPASTFLASGRFSINTYCPEFLPNITINTFGYFLIYSVHNCLVSSFY